MASKWWAGHMGFQGPMEQQSQLNNANKLNFDHHLIKVSGNHDDDMDNTSDEPKEGAVEQSTEGGVGGPVRRPRGRPPGSKNKGKPPIFVTRDSPNALRSHVMEVADGADVAESIATYARRRQRGVSVLSATGSVSNVSLRQPPEGAVVALQGRLEILSLSGSFLPGPVPIGSTALTVYLSGGHGKVLGGSVVGPIIASGPVLVIAATFSSAAYERLPLEDDHGQVEGGRINGLGYGPECNGEGSPSSNAGSGPGPYQLGDHGNLGQGYANMMQNGGISMQLGHDGYANWAQNTRPPY